ncbi:ATP-dependent 3'-5' DNA helicase [Cyberlindnera jadinii NRRL Y-1542]|uniref:DNA 3'-5' helicase n=1 Tax=Cyberlindnera jadinii (strain ATCC 18201 / CBS 1600 / BCRC 20928 / JCM 3617 / NBRC 0987 / NRRL Y-1542) TaxID=983966 RepID=A0A1E4S9B3_CYBJN|nr:P-loop containing nucleoside triphosphate hydrolase protein [Cyberlindnera jadinii NRRL Y-1542]ODV76058.1 P-loop containing nucleoside triphosphate hydrolase protein [Cyberlindnera jadinii NRRL Y-1542]
MTGNITSDYKFKHGCPHSLVEDMSLTKEIAVTPTQAKIIRHPIEKKKTLNIISGPGAGKTTTLVNKVAYMIGEEIVKPEKVLVLSMTNRAVDGFLSRLQDQLDEETAALTDIETFHGLAHRELMKYDPSYGFSELIEDPGWRVLGMMSGVKRKFELQRIVELLKTRGLTADERDEIASEHRLSRETIDELFKILETSQAVTYNEFLRDYKRLLRDGKIKTDYDVVIVDEFQDVYPELWELVELLARNSHLIVAGDPYQSIYGFLGDNGIVQSQLEHFHEMDRVEMYDCFRSPPEVIKSSEYIIETDRGVKSYLKGEKPILMKMRDSTEQFEYVIDEIMRLVTESNDAVKLGDIAVLTRTNRELEELIKMLNKYGLDTLKLSSSPSWCDGNLFYLVDYMRILNNPQRSHFAVICTLLLLPEIGPVTVRNIEARARRNKMSLYDYLVEHRDKLKPQLQAYIDVMEDMRLSLDPNSTSDIMDKLLIIADELGLRKFLSRSILFDDDKNHVTTQVLDFNESLKMFAHLKPDNQTVLEYFLQSYMDRLPISTVKDAVKVSTIHSSKGLEFPVVFMIGSKPALLPREHLSPEDRRVYYVGMTRAKHLLYNTVVENKDWPIDMGRIKKEAGHLFQFNSPVLSEPRSL